MSIYKFQSYRADQGYEWTKTNLWTSGKALTLHPVGDPTWNELDTTQRVELPDNVWSEFIKTGKGLINYKGHMPVNPSEESLEVFQKKIVKFANIAGFDKYVPVPYDLMNMVKEKADAGNPRPTTIENIAGVVRTLVSFNHHVNTRPVISDHAIQWLNSLSTRMDYKPVFKKDGLEFETTNIFSSIFISWYQSAVRKQVHKCVICKFPYFARYTSSETCSGTCRNKKSKGSK
jgi:hypothetical protein